MCSTSTSPSTLHAVRATHSPTERRPPTPDGKSGGKKPHRSKSEKNTAPVHSSNSREEYGPGKHGVDGGPLGLEVADEGVEAPGFPAGLHHGQPLVLVVALGAHELNAELQFELAQGTRKDMSVDRQGVRASSLSFGGACNACAVATAERINKKKKKRRHPPANINKICQRHAHR